MSGKVTFQRRVQLTTLVEHTQSTLSIYCSRLQAQLTYRQNSHSDHSDVYSHLVTRDFEYDLELPC